MTDNYTIRYYASERQAYWLLWTPECNTPLRFCSNRYASFTGWEPGSRQVHGNASSPLWAHQFEDMTPNTKAMRRYFLRLLRKQHQSMDDGYRPAPKFSVRRIDTFTDLETLDHAKV